MWVGSMYRDRRPIEGKPNALYGSWKHEQIQVFQVIVDWSRLFKIKFNAPWQILLYRWWRPEVEYQLGWLRTITEEQRTCSSYTFPEWWQTTTTPSTRWVFAPLSYKCLNHHKVHYHNYINQYNVGNSFARSITPQHEIMSTVWLLTVYRGAEIASNGNCT